MQKRIIGDRENEKQWGQKPGKDGRGNRSGDKSQGRTVGEIAVRTKSRRSAGGKMEGSYEHFRADHGAV